MKKLFIILIMFFIIPLVMAVGDKWILIFSDGTTTINGTDVCLNDGTCLSQSAAAGVIWSQVVNGTTFLQSEWDANYTANNDNWLNTTNLTYDAYNNTGLIIDWNSSGLIKDWGSISDTNETTRVDLLFGFNYYNLTNFDIADYYLESNPFSFYNSTNPSPETLWNANYSTFLTHVTWGNAVNGTLALVSQLVGLVGNWSADKSDYWNTSVDLSVSTNLETTGNVTADNFKGKFNWTTTDEWSSFDGTTFDFNESNLETTYFLANATQVVTGSGAGDLADIQTYNQTAYNVTESNSDFELIVNFTEITEFTTLIVRHKTSGETGHLATIQMWDYSSSTWEVYGYLSEETTSTIQTFGVYDSSEHIEDGVVQVRFYQSEVGAASHIHQFDWVGISKGYGTPVGTEVDPLSFHKEKNINNSGYNITADYFFGDGSQLENLPTDTFSGSNYSSFLYHITWENATNGTLMSQATFNTNYSTNDVAYRNTTNLTYNAYNSTGLIIDWNASNYIINWNTSGFIANWSLIIGTLSETLWNSNYSLFQTHITWENATNGTLLSQADFDSNYTDWNSSNLIIDWNVSNYIIDWNSSGYIINWSSYLSGVTWANVINGTMFSQADWNSNYTANNDNWLSITNTSYYLATNPFTFWNSTFATFNETYADTLYVNIDGDNMIGNLNISIGNITISQDNYFCLVQDCTSNISNNGTHSIWW